MTQSTAYFVLDMTLRQGHWMSSMAAVRHIRNLCETGLRKLGELTQGSTGIPRNS